METQSNRRIVVVEDDPLFRESLCDVFTELKFEVRPFESGEVALAHLPSFVDSDLVLLDWKMPGMTGIEVLHRLREATVAAPVIFLTGLHDQVYEEAALRAGAVDFVDKTRGVSILLKRVNLILDRTKASGPGAANSAESDNATIRYDDLELCRSTSRAVWKGIEVPLSVVEFSLVDFLISRRGRDVRYKDMYNLVHPSGFVAGMGEDKYRANVRAFIKRIREKFREIDENWDSIENYSGFGYRWRQKESVAS